jgi:hypothetical protein
MAGALPGFQNKSIRLLLALIEARLINSNTGPPCEITCSSVAIPRIVLPALVMAADGLDLPSVSLNIARFPFFALLRH